MDICPECGLAYNQHKSDCSKHKEDWYCEEFSAHYAHSNCKDILMTEEQYQFFDKLFNNINNSWERFVEAFSCYRMIFNKEQLSKKYSELIKSYKPFECDIEQWCNRIDKMNETVEKDLKKLIK